ncbi:MAG: CoA-binding protein [Actinobacteria bacterium]|nr:CoA-binding protein [Actinomycetota bacterium]MDI6832033.1 CoA-binding protein [Actinomycetota bacterium]
MVQDMEPFFNPASVAVAGASSSTAKLGNVTLSNLLRFGYRGRIYAIHPRAGEILGVPAFPSLRDIGEPVEVAVGVLPRDHMLPFVRDCADAGVRRVIVCAAGYSDAGAEGAEMQRRLKRAVRERGMRMMGPNSVGTISTSSGFVTSLMSLDPLRAGDISIVAQTGLFAGGFARWVSSTQRFGISKVACLGNKADVDEVDVLAYLRDDASTGVIAVYSEGIQRGREFLELASEVTLTKPVLMLKGGGSELGSRMAASHTGTLAGEEAVLRGALAQAGVIAVEGIEGLFDAAKALSYCPVPAGPNLGVVSITGAGTVLVADACQRRGLPLPPPSPRAERLAGEGLPPWVRLGNPMDIWAATLQGTVEDAYRVILRAFASEKDMHMLMAVFTLVPESEFDAAALLAEIREEHPQKPLLACILGASEEDRRRWFTSLEDIGVPVYDTVERCVGAAWALARYGMRRARAGGERARCG